MLAVLERVSAVLPTSDTELNWCYHILQILFRESIKNCSHFICFLQGCEATNFLAGQCIFSEVFNTYILFFAGIPK